MRNSLNTIQIYQETFETWEKLALLYQEKFMDLSIYNDSYDLFCEKLPNHKSEILEIGCGPGNITKYLLYKRPDFSISGIDVAQSMIKLAKQNNPQADFKVMDCREIDSIKATFDAIMIGFCIPYLSEIDVEKLIKDCNCLLANNGIIYISYVDGKTEKSGYQINSKGDKMYFNYYPTDTINKILTNANFKILNTLEVLYPKTVESNEMHTVIIAQKNKLVSQT